MPAQQKTVVALSDDAKKAIEKSLIKRGGSMAGYFSSPSGGRFVSDATVQAAKDRGSTIGNWDPSVTGEDYSGQASQPSDPFSGAKRRTTNSGVAYLDSFMARAQSTAEGQASYDMDLALRLFQTPEERRDERESEARSSRMAEIRNEVSPQLSRIQNVIRRVHGEAESRKIRMSNSDRNTAVARARANPIPVRQLLGDRAGAVGLWFE